MVYNFSIMLKNTVMAAVAALLTTVALSAQPDKDAGIEEACAPDKNPPIVLAAPDHQGNGEADKTKAGYDAPASHPPLHDPNWVLVIVGSVTCLVIGWQSFETRRAAKGAFLNAQAVINAERPWLLVTLEEVSGPGTGFIIRAKNKGRTPAMIVSARIGCAVAENVEKLPGKPPYGDGSLVQDHIVIPEDEPSVGWFDLSTLNKMTGNEAAGIEGQTFVFGIVLYRDLLDLSQTKPHETRWIYAYYHPRGDFGDSVLPAGGLGVSREYDHYS